MSDTLGTGYGQETTPTWAPPQDAATVYDWQTWGQDADQLPTGAGYILQETAKGLGNSLLMTGATAAGAFAGVRRDLENAGYLASGDAWRPEVENAQYAVDYWGGVKTAAADRLGRPTSPVEKAVMWVADHPAETAAAAIAAAVTKNPGASARAAAVTKQALDPLQSATTLAALTRVNEGRPISGDQALVEHTLRRWAEQGRGAQIGRAALEGVPAAFTHDINTPSGMIASAADLAQAYMNIRIEAEINKMAGYSPTAMQRGGSLAGHIGGAALSIGLRGANLGSSGYQGLMDMGAAATGQYFQDLMSTGQPASRAIAQEALWRQFPSGK